MRRRAFVNASTSLRQCVDEPSSMRRRTTVIVLTEIELVEIFDRFVFSLGKPYFLFADYSYLC